MSSARLTQPGRAQLAARLASQLLAGSPARSATAVVTRILAVQAQDPRGARLAVRSRSTGVVAADIDRALTAERSLLVTWLNRGTLHLVAAADYWWLHPLTTPQLVSGNRRRLQQEGVSAAQTERGVDAVRLAVASQGPLTRAQLRQRLDDAGVPTAGQALIHVLFAASIRGHLVRGPMIGGEQAYVSVPAWLGPPPALPDREQSLGDLARRYLAGHAPASPEDLARWAGLRLGDARRGFAVIADELLEAVGGSVLALSDPRQARLPPPRLLGPFDPLLHGWASREHVVGRHQDVVTSNGIFRPTALVGGRVVAIWGLSGGVITIRRLETVTAAALRALVADAARVLDFLGLRPRPAVIA